MPAKVDWYYHRPGCITCKRMQGYLESHSVDVKETTLTTKNKLSKKDALALAKEATKIVVAKGKKVVSFDMKKDPPDDKTLLAHMLGPTGNLRAPTVRRGKTLFVGFNEEELASFLGT